MKSKRFTLSILLVLRQVVLDLEPRGLRPDEDVLGRPDARLVRERAERDVDVRAVADDREEQRSALRAARVILVGLADDHQLVAALPNPELLPFDPREGLERRSGRSAAVRAVAVRRVSKLVR